MTRTSVLALALLSVLGVFGAAQIREDAVQATRATYYAQGVKDGAARIATPAPAAVTAKVNGFCDGNLQLDWFDTSMNVTQQQIDAYAAESHECTVVRYLGSLSVTNYQGDTGTDYIYVLTLHGKETWWVFTITAAGKIADVQ